MICHWKQAACSPPPCPTACKPMRWDGVVGKNTVFWPSLSLLSCYTKHFVYFLLFLPSPIWNTSIFCRWRSCRNKFPVLICSGTCHQRAVCTCIVQSCNLFFFLPDMRLVSSLFWSDCISLNAMQCFCCRWTGDWRKRNLDNLNFLSWVHHCTDPTGAALTAHCHLCAYLNSQKTSNSIFC